MDASYTWHSGTRGVEPIWARSIALLPDELMSSWLVRAALAQGCDPFVLTGCIWPEWRVWTGDIDRTVSTDRLKPLSEQSGINSEAFRHAMLQPWADRISGRELRRTGAWPWVLTLGARNSKRRSGLQFCPECFAEDTEPYYRLQWRFAWHTGCVKHGCGLLDRCGKCNSSMEPHHLHTDDGCLAVCSNCRSSLIATQSRKWHKTARRFQNEADQVVLRGSGTAFGVKLVGDEWFRVAQYAVRIVRHASQYGSTALGDFLKALDSAPTLPTIPDGAAIEEMRVWKRQELFGPAMNLLSVDRTRFIKTARQVGLTRQGLLVASAPKLSLMSEMLDELVSVPKPSNRKPKQSTAKPRSPFAVKRMMQRLVLRLKLQS